MSARGRKLRTADNTADGHPGFIRRDDEGPTSDLEGLALEEYERLRDVLHSKGTLDRVDLAVLTEAARVKVMLDEAYKVATTDLDRGARLIQVLTTQRRGLLREMGLTLQPSRSVVRTNAVSPEEDPLAKMIKLSG
jgi:hypothetical protein